jgi:hypothetical protein
MVGDPSHGDIGVAEPFLQLGDVRAGIEWFDQCVRTRDTAVKQRSLDYNEDDCRAMRVLLDRMKMIQVRGYGD